jgi:hypothetical protein
MLLCALTLGAGCTTISTDSPTVVATPSVVSPLGYPIAQTPVSGADTSYPGPSVEISPVSPSTLEPPSEAPVPADGFAALSGMLYSYIGQRVISGTQFYFTPAVGENRRLVPLIIAGPEANLGDIPGQTDNQGRFSLNQVPPGNYYLVIWAPLNWILAENSQQDPTPRLVELSANQSVPLGLVVAPWP